MTPIVLLVGQGRSGKDTAGAAIASAFGGVCVALGDPIKRFFASPAWGLTAAQLWGDKKEVEFTLTPPWYADCLVRLSEALNGRKTAAQLSSLSLESWLLNLPKGKTTPRHLMQTFGTECVRERYPNFWIDHGLWTAEHLLVGGWEYTREAGIVRGAKRYDLMVFPDGRFRNEALSVKRNGGVLLRVTRPNVQEGFSATARAHASETEQVTIPAMWFDGLLANTGTLAEFQAHAVKTLTALGT